MGRDKRTPYELYLSVFLDERDGDVSEQGKRTLRGAYRRFALM